MNILVILTGGTIGSSINDHLINVNDNSVYLLIEAYKEKYGQDVNFDVIRPINMLSENFTPEQWNVLTDVLLNTEAVKYDGVIITHGSDTLPYSSALIGMMFSHTPIPIILVASGHPLGHPLSNGLENFRNAVCFIKNENINGVFSIYRGCDGRNTVYLSTRIKEADSYSDEFSSFGGVPFGYMVNEHFLPKISPLNPTIDEINSINTPVLKNKLTFSKDILVIKPYTGLNYKFLNLDANPACVLHFLYHSSTGCTSSGDYSLPDFIAECKKRGIDFYLSSFKNTNANMYDSSRILLESGAKPLLNISSEAARAKLHIAYNQNEISPIEYISKNLYFEHINNLMD
ncbi:MAG: asparaginase [Clostridia bacterium]|nr:asparaginase [Clostridia bacterium]